VGPFDSPDIPFELVASNENGLRERGSYVAEVHPALAIWLWCRKRMGKRIHWAYKKDHKLAKHLWRTILKILASEEVDQEILSSLGDIMPANDDELDVLVSWLLGTLWTRKAVSNSKQLVQLLGDRNVGCMLLPSVVGLRGTFELAMRHLEEGARSQAIAEAHKTKSSE